MSFDVLEKLPSRQEVVLEIAAMSSRARRLRALYKLLTRIERERSESDQRSSGISEGSSDG